MDAFLLVVFLCGALAAGRSAAIERRNGTGAWPALAVMSLGLTACAASSALEFYGHRGTGLFVQLLGVIAIIMGAISHGRARKSQTDV